MNDPFARDRRKVELVPHEPEWAARAAAESERLAQAIGDTLIRIEHVGSTSIHGIVAKPIIDLMPIVRSHSELDARRPQVEALGYVWRGEFGIPGRRYCIMEQEGRRLFHVHCHQEGHPGIAHTVDFRDYLRAHPEEARIYETQKRAAAAAHPDDSLAYTNAKSDWIRACVERATEWAKTRRQTAPYSGPIHEASGIRSDSMIPERLMLRTCLALASAALLVTAASADEPQVRPAPRGVISTAASGLVLSTAQYGANIISGTLEAALKRSRDAARVDSKPIPDEIRNGLIPFYPAELLENVRYSIGDTTPGGVAGFAIRNGNAAAVTLIDTVVFSSEDHVRNLALWAHEIHHVQQYNEWSVAGFATRYAFNWQDVEAEATARAHAFVAWYKERTGQN